MSLHVAHMLQQAEEMSSQVLILKGFHSRGNAVQNEQRMLMIMHFNTVQALFNQIIYITYRESIDQCFLGRSDQDGMDNSYRHE